MIINRGNCLEWWDGEGNLDGERKRRGLGRRKTLGYGYTRAHARLGADAGDVLGRFTGYWPWVSVTDREFPRGSLQALAWWAVGK